jgi:hypothetical protein
MEGNEVQGAISANDVTWQVRFEELVEEVAKISTGGYLDAKKSVEVNTRIASCPSTTLLVREKVAEASPLAPPLSPPTGSYRVSNPSPLSPPENNEEQERQSPPPQC